MLDVRIAVLLPVYGAPEKMRATVASLREQHVPFDIVIVDDGNMPPLEAPMHPDRRKGQSGDVIMLRQPTNMGLIAALNRGMAEIRERGYEFVARIDAGDLSLPGRLEKQLAAFDADEDLALCGTLFNSVMPDGTDLGIRNYPVSNEEIKSCIRYRAAFCHPTVMIRMSIFHDMDFYRDGYVYAEDCELFFRIAQRYKCCNLPISTLIYEHAEDSISARKAREQALTTLRIYLENFHPLYWQSWLGVASKLPNLFLSREQMNRLKEWVRFSTYDKASDT